MPSQVSPLAGLGALGPVSVPVVDEDENACQQPRHGVAREHGVDAVVARHKGEQPEHTKDAGAEHGEQHRAQALAGAADGAGYIVHKRVEHVKRRNVGDHLRCH